MVPDQDRFRESGLAAQVARIRDTVGRFDETTHAAADRIRDAEVRFFEGTIEQAEASAIYEAAVGVVPHAPDLVRMLSNLDYLPYAMQSAIPELVNETNIARIADALRFIDDELNNYFADSDSIHLTNALESGLHKYQLAVRRSFGYWQKGRDPEMVTADLDLSRERRDKLTGKLRASLQGWIPGSRTELRGSLRTGTADEYSDIGICWVVPDQDFNESVDTLGAALSQCSAVLALCTDPGFAHSAERRVVFARLSRMPLFWRVDIDIRAGSAATDDHYQVGNPDAPSDTGWPAPAGAIENAIAAIKAAARGQANTAEALLRRGCDQIAHTPYPTADLADAIAGLSHACATQEPRLARMAAEVRQLADHFLRRALPGDD
jgi:hypothetical protein